MKKTIDLLTYPTTNYIPYNQIVMNKDYVIHEDGKIWSNKSNKFLKPLLNNGTGYMHVALRIDGKTINFQIHRLVAQKFHPNPENKREVNHKDGDKTNNHVDNLEWNTSSENQKHGLEMGLCKPPPRNWDGKFGYNHNRSIEVHQFDGAWNYVRSYGSQSEAARENGCSVSTINMAIKNKTKSRSGFYYKPHYQLYVPE